MDTLRLKAIQVPNRTLALLESFAEARLRVTPDMPRPARLDELPAHLRRHVGDGPGQYHVWFAWHDGDETFLITGAMSLDLARERGRPVLEIRRYGSDGSLLDCGAWIRAGAAQWERSHW